VTALCGHSFNAVLINQYRDGNDRMGWHSDDEPELGVQPWIASYNLGAKRAFAFRRRGQTRTGHTLELAHDQLLLMSPGVQHGWQHAVPVRQRIHDRRINLPFRHIVENRERGGSARHLAEAVEWTWFLDTVALDKINADTAQALANAIILDILGDGALAHQVTHLIDRADQRQVGGIIRYITDKAAIDLDVIDRQMLQVAIRGQPRTKIIQRETTTQSLQLTDKIRGVFQIGNGRRLRDLETDTLTRYRVALEMFEQEFEQGGVIERMA